jgi:hypothetical protein
MAAQRYDTIFSFQINNQCFRIDISINWMFHR